MRGEDDVARREGERASGEVQAVAGVGRERDLARLGVQEPRHGDAGGLEAGLQLAVGQEMRGGPLRGEFIERAARALGDRADGGVVQVDGIRGPREFRGAQRTELVAQRAQPGGVVRDVGHARTSRASRNPSPTRFTPSTTNESAASAMIAPPTPSVPATITGPRTLGRTWRATSRPSDTPRARAACT